MGAIVFKNVLLLLNFKLPEIGQDEIILINHESSRQKQLGTLMVCQATLA